jgi:hypothetical protein
MSSMWRFLYKTIHTYLPIDIENPFLCVLFSSKNEVLKYLEAEGDTVKSLVKSLLVPFPIETPYLLGLMPLRLYILSQYGFYLENRFYLLKVHRFLD